MSSLDLKSGFVSVTEHGALLEVTLDRPDKLNALSTEMYQDLSRAVDHLRERDDLNALLLNANGRSFTAGNDIGDFLNAEQVGIRAGTGHHRRIGREHATHTGCQFRETRQFGAEGGHSSAPESRPATITRASPRRFSISGKIQGTPSRARLAAHSSSAASVACAASASRVLIVGKCSEIAPSRCAASASSALSQQESVNSPPQCSASWS